MNETIEHVTGRLRERFPEAVGAPTEEFGEVSIEVRAASLEDVARHLREDFELLADWSCVDMLGIEPAERRFVCCAHLASVRHPHRLRVRVFVPESDPRCPTLVHVWPGAAFQEREMYDFFGVWFDGHDDLRRMFMPDDWDGHPQRKDYPLGGVNVQYQHGAFIPPPDLRRQPTTTTGYPGRTA
jgi:NADH-quinone oxidoreductase subunit C